MCGDGGLGFDLLSSLSNGQRVIIGHANGIVSLDLAESLDDHREALRVRLGEPYRTMLGHLRHEVGHYYQNVLLTDDRAWGTMPRLLGDERASYRDAVKRHYSLRRPAGLAVLVHLRVRHDASVGGLRRDVRPLSPHHPARCRPRRPSASIWTPPRRLAVTPTSIRSRRIATEPVERLLSDWDWMSQAFNRINRAMGFGDLYPFQLPAPVRDEARVRPRHGDPRAAAALTSRSCAALRSDHDAIAAPT